MTVPIHVIAGFLGSGKTTLLNYLLHHVPTGLRPAIIVNDFGRVAIDGKLVEGDALAMIELASGCICCSLQGALIDGLAELVEEQAPDVILIESAGIAQPAELPPVFDYTDLSNLVDLGNVVCVVDATTFSRYAQQMPMLRLQVEQANTIVLNKVADASPDTLVEVRQRLEYQVQPGAVIVDSNFGELDVGLIYDQRPIYFVQRPSAGVVPDHGFHSHTVEDSVATYDCERLCIWLDTLVGHVERAKGMLRTSAGMKLVQLTPGAVEVSDWHGPPVSSRIVFIGRELEGVRLEEVLQGLSV